MKKLIVALACVFVIGSVTAPVHAQSDTAAQQATGRVLVKPRAGLPLPELDRIVGAAGGRRAAVLERIDVHVIAVPQGREAAVVQALSRNPHIRFAEIDRLVEPNDPGLIQQWYVPMIGADTAWTSSNAIGEGVVLAVCDTGVSSTHPDLSGRLVLPGYNTVDKSSNSEPLNGHGTMVAGTIAMIGGNSVGGVGVAYGGMILPVRVSNRGDGSAYISDIAACITYAADHEAKPRGANASYGVCGSSTVVSAANYMRSKGGVVTVSAGNSGRKESHAQSSALTCVSATDNNDGLTSWSSFGNYVDVSAPGASIYTTNKEGGYSFVNGTSFSAPITLAVYGLMMSASPHLSPPELDQILFETARDRGTSGYDMYYGWGRIDAAFAVSRARGVAPGIDSVSPSASIQSPASGAFVRGAVPVDVSATDNLSVTRVELYAGGTLAGTDISAPYQFSVDTTRGPEGSLTLRAIAYDAAGNPGSATIVVNVDNTQPNVTIASPPTGATVSGTITVSVNASDTNLSQITLTIDGKRVASSSGSTLSYSWKVCQTPKNCGGTATLVAEATDRAGNTKTHTVTVTRSK